MQHDIHLSKKRLNMPQETNNRLALEQDIATFKEALNDDGLTDTDKQMIQSAIATAEVRLASLGNANNNTKQATAAVKENCPPTDEKGTRLITPEALALLSKCIADAPDTKALHVDKNGNYTEERKALHEQILSELNNQECIKQRRPIAILMGGLPGSGKSTFLSKNLKWVTDDNFYWIDADQIREKLPEYKGWNASNTHNETKELVAMAIENIAKNCKYDIVYDGTMTSESGYSEMLKMLKENDYRVFIIYIHIDTETAVERALNRYVVSGRYVPIEVIRGKHKGVSGFDFLKDKVDGYVLVDGLTGTITEKKGEEIPPNRPFDYITKKEKVKSVNKTDIKEMTAKEKEHSERLEAKEEDCCECPKKEEQPNDVYLTQPKNESKPQPAVKSKKESNIDRITEYAEHPEFKDRIIFARMESPYKKEERDIDPLTEDAPHPEIKNKTKPLPNSAKGIDSDFVNMIDTAVNGSAEHQAETQLKSSLKTLLPPKKSTKGVRAHKPYKRAEKGQYRLVIPDNELTIENKTLNYKRADVFLVPLSDIEVNTALFQNREEAYSQVTFDNLERAYQNGDFYLEVMDPILLYREAATDNLFTINHSRFAWFKHALKNGYTLPQNNNFDFSHIPARIIDGNKVSLEKIIQIARNSNNLSTPEKVYERVTYYQQLLDDGADKKKIIDDIGRHELYNSKIIKSAIHLNPNGKAFEWLKRLSEDIENPPNIRNIVYIVGQLRNRHPELTDAHEAEITDWLIEGGYGVNAGQVRTLTEANDKITRLVEKITVDGDIDEEKPLNPKQLLSKNYVRSEWEKTLKVATNALRIAEKELSAKTLLFLEKAAKEKENIQVTDERVFKETAHQRSNVLSKMKDVRDALLMKPNVASAEKQAVEIFEAA